MFETIIPEKKYYIGNTCVSFTVNDINNMFQNEEPFDELLMMSFGTIFYEYDEKEDFMFYEQNPLVMRFDDEDKKINIDGEYGAVPDLLFTEIYCRLLYDDLNGSNLGHWLFVAVYRNARNIVIVEGTERKTDIRQRYEKHLDDILRHIGWRDDDEERNYKYNQVSMSNRQEKRKIDNLSNDSWMISHVLIPSKDSEFLCGPVSLAALENCCEHDHDWSSFRRSFNWNMLKENLIKSFKKKLFRYLTLLLEKAYANEYEEFDENEDTEEKWNYLLHCKISFVHEQRNRERRERTTRNRSSEETNIIVV